MQFQPFGRDLEELQDAPNRALEIAHDLLVGKLERRDAVLLKITSPIRILGLADANKGIDCVEVELRLTLSPGIIADPACIGLPSARLLGAIMGDRTRDFVGADRKSTRLNSS